MKSRIRNTVIIVSIAVIYIALFIPLNTRCAENRNMLLCAGSDEYAQYPYVISMTTCDSTVLDTISRMLDHKHYYYGYPFYFISAAVITPIRIYSKFCEGNYTRAHILLLRQLSPVFMTGVFILLVAMWTKFRSLFSGFSLLVFLGAVPAVFTNNTWWHPDSMVTFFVVGTLFCLEKDALRFGKWFYAASIACGLAVSTKVLGLFFAPCVLMYLTLGVIKKKLNHFSAVRRGATFIGVMIATVILTYPILLDFPKAQRIFETLKTQAEMIKFGWGVRMDKGLMAHYRESLRDSFGWWPVYLLSLTGGCVGVIFDRNRRLLNFLILSWSLPYFAYLIFAVARKSSYYFIPALVPFLSLMWNPCLWRIGSKGRLLVGAMAMLVAIQFSLYIVQNARTYRVLWKEERDSPAIAFYQELLKRGILPDGDGSVVRVFRDPYVYLPPRNAFNQRMKWGSADYSDIDGFEPQFVILLRNYIERNSDPERINISFDKKQAIRSYEFYKDSKNDVIRGYKAVFSNDFAVAFRRVDQK